MFVVVCIVQVVVGRGAISRGHVGLGTRCSSVMCSLGGSGIVSRVVSVCFEICGVVYFLNKIKNKNGLLFGKVLLIYMW